MNTLGKVIGRVVGVDKANVRVVFLITLSGNREDYARPEDVELMLKYDGREP